MEYLKERHFGGKLSGFTDKAENKLENKHLAAYLKGHETFISGYEKIWSVKTPIRTPVKAIWS